MKAGKITAKLRDAVRVCFIVEGIEVKRYKNIEIPDALKELEVLDFAFTVLTDGKIEFSLHFAQGILPIEWPELRARKTRTPKVAQGAIDNSATAMEHMNVEKAEVASAEIDEATEAIEAAVESENAPEATEPAIQPAVAPEADIMPVKQPAKRGRKLGSRFNKQNAGATAQ